MLKKLIIATLLIMFANILYSEPPNGTIIIEVLGFKNSKGLVYSHLFNSPLGFPKESNLRFRKIPDGKIKSNHTATLVFDNVPYGTYALTVHHDENMNGKMDRNFIGYPKESFGVSNNPSFFPNIPDWDECKFDLDTDTLRLKVDLKFN